MACHPWHAHIYIYFIFPSNIHDGIGSQTSVQRRAQRMPSASKHAHPPWLNEATCCSTYIQACNIPSRRAQKGSCKDMHVRIHVRTPPGVHPSTYPPDTHTTHKHVPVSHRILPTIGDFFLRFYWWFFSLNEYYFYIDIVGCSAVWLDLQCSSPIIHHPPHLIHTIPYPSHL